MSLLKITVNKALAKIGYKITKADPPGFVDSRTWANQMLEQYQPLIKGDVLEVGCGTSSYIRERYRAQCTLTTFDQIKHKNVDVTGNLLTLSHHVSANYYDVVIANQTMEHVPQPFQVIAEIYKVLKPGGLFIAITPFMYGIHGEEYGDYWRITRQGWRVLLSAYSHIEDLAWLGTELYPHQYAVVAKK